VVLRRNSRCSKLLTDSELLPIHVEAYSGYKASEPPRQFVLDEQIYEIAAVLDQWYEPSATYFKVQTVDSR
jgi:hypothetical protein